MAISSFKFLFLHLLLNMDVEVDRKLRPLYEKVKGYEDILKHVNSGLRSFDYELAYRGLRDESRSLVHADEDVEVQSFFVCIPSTGIQDFAKEMRHKAYLVKGAHFFDDHVDNPDLNFYLEGMMKNRGEIRSLLASMERVGEVADFLACTTDHSDGVYKALRRIVYGGLIQFSENQSTQEMLFEEHKDIAIKGLDRQFGKDAANIRPIAYWLTTKAILEMFFAAESAYNPTQTEAWNLVYSPAFYAMNAAEEEEHEGMKFLGNEKPKTDEMREMIDIGTSHIINIQDVRLPKRVLQMEFMLGAFEPVLGDLSEVYSKAYSRLKRACR
jgi:hypothetical protein